MRVGASTRERGPERLRESSRGQNGGATERHQYRRIYWPEKWKRRMKFCQSSLVADGANCHAQNSARIKPATKKNFGHAGFSSGRGFSTWDSSGMKIGSPLNWPNFFADFGGVGILVLLGTSIFLLFGSVGRPAIEVNASRSERGQNKTAAMSAGLVARLR